MPEIEKKTIIDELNGKLSALRDERDRLENETLELAEKRDKLNDRVRGLRAEIYEIRARRDEVNSKVKDMKQRRNEITMRIHERVEEMRKAQEEYASIYKKKPSQSHRALQKEVENIDWEIQTTPTTLQEDRELVGKVKQLETQLVVHKRLERLTDKIAELRTQTKTMRLENQQLHAQLTANAQAGQEAHGKMLERLADSRTLKAQADDIHRQYLQTRAKIKPVSQEARAIRDQILQLQGKIRADLQKEKDDNESALRETLEKQAKEKLKRGGKLSWEEFQLLAEKGMTEQD